MKKALLSVLALFLTVSFLFANVEKNENGITTGEGTPGPVIPQKSTEIFKEIFSGAVWPPAGWTVQNTHPTVNWGRVTTISISGTPPTVINPVEGTHFARCHWSDQAGTTQDEKLITPSINLTNLQSATLSFSFNGSYHWSVAPNNNCDLFVKASVGGGPWVQLWTETDHPQYTSTAVNWQWLTTTINLASLLGQANVRFMFQYVGFDGAHFGIDVVRILGTATPTNHQVTFSVVGGNGTLAATVDAAPITSPATVAQGKNVVFTATPAANFRVKEWKLNSAVVAGNTTNTFTLTNLQAAATVTVEFEAIPPPLPKVTFNVNMTPLATFNPASDKVYISGSFPAPNGWNEPGSNANLELTRVGTTMVWTKTLDLPAGTYGYKFFRNAGWNGGEWTGDPNRPLIVGTTDRTINAIWGDITNSVPLVDTPEFNVFPNPTYGDLKVSGQTTIQSVRVLNMIGQQVIGLNNLDSEIVIVPTANLRAGYYIVSVTDINGNTVNNRFMKR